MSSAALTGIEANVLALLEEGANRIDIGRELGLAPAAVNTLVDSIHRKAGTGRRIDLSQRGLSVGQMSVLRLVLEGHTNGTIAQRLYLSRETVRERLRSVYAHLGVRNRYEAIAMLTQERAR